MNPVGEYLLYWRLGPNEEARGIERWDEQGVRIRNAVTHGEGAKNAKETEQEHRGMCKTLLLLVGR